MKKERNNKGITLIALIITIIVMLILVGVSVNVALNGGLFDAAKQAVSGMNMGQIREKAEMTKVVLIADAQTDTSMRLSKQEYISRLLQEFEGSTSEGYKVIVEDRKYDIIIKNTDLDIEVQEHSDEVGASSLTALSYTTSDVEENGKNTTNVELTLQKATMTLEQYKGAKAAQETRELTQEEKNKIAFDYISNIWYDTEQTFNNLDEVVVYGINDYYETTAYTTIEECLDDEKVKEEWGTTKEQLYYNCYYYEFSGNGDEMTEQQVLDLFFQEAHEYNQRNKETEYAAEYNRYTMGLKLYVSKDGKAEETVATSLTIRGGAKTISYSVKETGTYEFIIKTSLNGEEEEILREVLRVNNM